ncbi:translation protein SH3-like domain-containing protein [Xylariaceae sp. FL0016]|nr:translation protein SH3-like domain-containing protein [Xylariaceae sp. FL0016]
MIVQAARRPLGCWKAVMRRTRQQQQLMLRPMATATTPTSAATPSPPPGILPTKPTFCTMNHYFLKFQGRCALHWNTPNSLPSYCRYANVFLSDTMQSKDPKKPIRSAFAVYPRVPSARKTNPAALEAYHAQQIRRLDRTGARTQLFSKKNPDAAKVGDVLQVSTNRGEPFAGVCLMIRRSGVDTAILLRNHLTKLGVEMWYKIYSPNITGIEIIWRRPKRARRAKLTYMRQPKHDMGNVDHLVESWRRMRNVFSSKSKGANSGRQGKHKKR